MTNLERRYRALLRMLPRWYREAREEEMVTTLLAGRRAAMDRAHGWPGWSETLAVLALAVSTRLAAKRGPQRAVVLGDIVRLAALLGLLVQVPRAVAGATDLVVTVSRGTFTPESVTYLLLSATEVAAAAALILLLTARRSHARACAGVALTTSLLTLAMSFVPAAVNLGMAEPHRIVAIHSSVWVAVGCLFAGFHREAPTPPARPWLLAVAGGAALTGAWIAARGVIDADPVSLPVLGDLGSLPGWTIIVAGIAFPIARVRMADGGVRWALAMAIVAWAVLPDRLNFLTFAQQLKTFDGVTTPFTVAMIQLIGLAAVSIPLTFLGIRRYRQLPRSTLTAPGT